MAERLESHDPDLPEAAEIIHMPEPSYLPVALAFGLLLAAMGIVTNMVVLALGVIITAVAFVLWLGKARREMAELPLEH